MTTSVCGLSSRVRRLRSRRSIWTALYGGVMGLHTGSWSKATPRQLHRSESPRTQRKSSPNAPGGWKRASIRGGVDIASHALENHGRLSVSKRSASFATGQERSAGVIAKCAKEKDGAQTEIPRAIGTRTREASWSAVVLYRF